MASGAPWRCIVLAGLGCALLGGCDGAGSPARGARPNVVIVMIDTLRADHLRVFGYPRDTAPFLTKLAADSVLFRRAFSTSSWTAPATASLFTGLYPTRHGLTQGYHAQRKHGGNVGTGKRPGAIRLSAIPSGATTLIERLERAGYRTFGYATNVNIGPRLGFQRGFARFQLHNLAEAPAVARAMARWKDEIESGAGPYLLYLHFMDVHQPYHDREPWYEAGGNELESEINRYDSEISYLDATLAQLYDAFGWDEDTILWIVSDHGEEFDDHGGRGHGFSLFQELLGVLMMVHAPGLGAAPSRVDANVSLIDVLPTTLDWIGAPLAPGDAVQGTSLLPLVRGEEARRERDRLEQRTLLAHRQKRGQRDEIYSAVRGRLKLIWNPASHDVLLFDLESDPAERSNLAGQRPADVRELLHSIVAERQQQSAGESRDIELTPEMLEMLRTLGYAQDARP